MRYPAGTRVFLSPEKDETCKPPSKDQIPFSF